MEFNIPPDVDKFTFPLFQDLVAWVLSLDRLSIVDARVNMKISGLIDSILSWHNLCQTVWCYLQITQKMLGFAKR